jgi:hypothetical protein
MATKLRAPSSTNVATTKGSPSAKANLAGPTFEEVFVRNDLVSLCLLLNRRARTMRVIDFRAGASPAKRLFVQSIARRERIEKVVVLVERDECATWARLGFAREGNIPGFYKRSDAFIMGQVVPPADASVAPHDRPAAKARESGVFTVGRHSVFPAGDADDHDLEEEAPAPAASAQAERTVTLARKQEKELARTALPAVKLAPLSAPEVQKRVAAATKAQLALTGFESFGRDVTRDDVVASSRGLPDLVVGAELQRCYGNAFVEVLSAPGDDKERNFLVAALLAACERLQRNDVVCAFGVSPADDVRMATAFIAAGFRRTGLLRQHLRLRSDRADAILWSRKLAGPDEGS